MKIKRIALQTIEGQVLVQHMVHAVDRYHHGSR